MGGGWRTALQQLLAKTYGAAMDRNMDTHKGPHQRQILLVNWYPRSWTMSLRASFQSKYDYLRRTNWESWGRPNLHLGFTVFCKWELLLAWFCQWDNQYGSAGWARLCLAGVQKNVHTQFLNCFWQTFKSFVNVNNQFRNWLFSVGLKKCEILNLFIFQNDSISTFINL